MKKFLTLALLLVFMLTSAVAQTIPALPIDPAVRVGKLPNGLTYYIRTNKMPENRVNFYIAQKVGSVQEEDSQRGLAHFLEHMCFNGTDNFPDDRIVKYCESIGVKFGYNLNAYTSTDETVYNIDDVPVIESNIDSCLLILHDWADGLTLADKEIDKERGVIHEEWRLRSSGSMRIIERNLPALYPSSRYGYRFPIGTMEVIDNFKYQELRDYYERWYRPDLQGIIIVGDINVDEMEAKVKKVFSPIKAQENPVAYEHYPVPSTPEGIYVVDKDKEQQMSLIQLMFKHDPVPAELRGTQAFLVLNYMMSLVTEPLNARLNELSKKSDCPFVLAQVSDDNYIVSKTMDAFTLLVIPKPGQDAAAVQAAVTELKRAAQHGITDTEVIRARENFLSAIDKIYDNREKQPNDFYVKQYVRHFLEGDAIPAIEVERDLYKAVAAQLPAQTASQMLSQLVASTDSNFVCFAMYPEKEGQPVPTPEALRAAVKAGMSAEVEAYVDNVKSEPLIPSLPAKGKVVEEKPAAFGYTQWKLSNGANVYYKVTDFNQSEVQVAGRSMGGKSLTKDADRINVELLDDVMSSTGLGAFSATELEKKMAGKQVSLKATLAETTDRLDGKSTPKDLRSLFELIHLRFQPSQPDEEGYNNTISFLRSMLENAEKVPEMAFSDSAKATIYNHDARMQRIRLADLDKADYAAIRRIYGERFASAGDFDFVFTGAINVDSLRQFSEQYIASLPALKGKREAYVDRGIRYAAGAINNFFTRKMETPKASIIQVWNGQYPWTVKNAAVVSALGNVLSERYLKSIREDASLAYSVGANAGLMYGILDEYVMQIYCPVKPEGRDEALKLMKQGLEDIAANGVKPEELAKVKEFELKDYADSQKKNNYWQDLVLSKLLWNKDQQAGYEDAIKNLSSADIQMFVKDVLLKQNNCVTVSMLPEE